MRSTPEEIVEELEELAAISADDLNEANAPLAQVIRVPDVGKEDTAEWQAASMIRRFVEALRKIAGDAPDPARIARDALDDAGSVTPPE
ncbi:hypothetical protein GGR16_002400 [Chelatococcus caeni]|uniref:Uncharacterized protein n=1 Tax=Chelatococcus caeni TaxID=1348468 RepID=A0A840BV86_9HYPH|nr:hypothetical protein [Chelatococcus caeni]MBB4017371.1 hypothetical protein [Chelatococcus caeni]